MARNGVIKEVLKMQLLFEPLQGMYIVTDGIHYSLWFDSYTKDELLDLCDNEFVSKCEEMIEWAETMNVETRVRV